MARTPSMSREDAENLLGPRGSLIVNSENRILVRKWLTACGLPSGYVGTLALGELQRLYNDITDAAVNTAAATAATGQATTSEQDQGVGGGKGSGGERAPMSGKTVNQGGADMPSEQAIEEAAGGGSGDMLGDAIAKKIAKALSASLPVLADAIKGDVPTVDALQEMMDKAAKKAVEQAGPKRIEIKLPEKPATELPEGIYHHQFEEALLVVSAGVPLCLVGPAGSGKTTVCEQVFAALGMGFQITGAVSGSHEFLGFVDGTGRYQSTPFRTAFEQGMGFCADEIDGGDSGGLLVLNSALANHYMPFPDRPDAPVKRHENFRMVACANTFGRGADRLYVGRNQLDAATLDRFYFLSWEYDPRLERLAAGGTPQAVTPNKPKRSSMNTDQWIDRVQKIRLAVEQERARMVVSPRASIFGAKLLKAGLSVEQCEAGLIWKGIDDELKKRVLSRVGA